MLLAFAAGVNGVCCCHGKPFARQEIVYAQSEEDGANDDGSDIEFTKVSEYEIINN